MAVRTLVELFETAVARHPRPDMLQSKKEGHWIAISSDEALQKVRYLASALAELGIGKGDRVAILSTNRPEWILADQAILRLGAVVVTIYPTLLSPQIEFILQDSGSVAVFCEDSAQGRKLDSVKANCPHLEHLFCIEPDNEFGGRSFDALVERGSELLSADENALPPATVEAEDLATLIYTSGTTGEPKGVMLSHKNLVSNVLNSLKGFDLGPHDNCLSFLPLSHVLERMAGYYIMVQCGVGISFAESVDTVAENMLEVKPTVMVSVPRLYEKIYTKVLDMAIQGPPLRRAIFFWAKNTGQKWVDHKVAGRVVPPHIALQKAVADALVFSKLRKRTGGRLRFFISGGAPLAKEIAEFFYAAGLVVYEGYGLTETSPVISVNCAAAFRPGSVGPPIPGVEVRVAEDGEILTRSDSVMMGYWNRPAATAEAMEDGWFHTGDIGYLDDDGFLYITDRKKDIIVTAGGKNVAPQPIENELKMSRYVTEVCLIGDKRKYLVALIVPNFEGLQAYLKRHQLSFPDLHSTLDSPKIQGLFQHLVDRINEGRPSYEQIKYFRLLEREFSQDEGELTPSLKVKRRVIQERYRDLIEQMYPKE